MTRITYMSDTQIISLQIEHIEDLEIINHNSIYSPINGMVGMNDRDYALWLDQSKSLPTLKSIVFGCDEVSSSYYRLMASGDIGEVVG